MTQRKVLITGAAGFIGRNLTQFLRDSGWSVVPLDNLSIQPQGPLPWGLLRADVLDLCPADLEGIDLVVHLAANKSVPKSFACQDGTIKNIQQDRHLLEVSASALVPKVVLASSCEVYGRQEGVPLLGEHEKYNPMSPYAVSKVALELHANVYRHLAPDTAFTCIRFFNIYGPDEGKDAVVPRFVHDMLTIGCVTIEGDGSQRRDFSFIDDMVRMLGDLFLIDRLPPNINLGSGESHSIKDLASLITETMGGGEIQYKSGRLNEIQNFCADTQLLEELLVAGIVRTGFSQGVLKCISETKKNNKISNPVNTSNDDAIADILDVFESEEPGDKYNLIQDNI